MGVLLSTATDPCEREAACGNERYLEQRVEVAAVAVLRDDAHGVLVHERVDVPQHVRMRHVRQQLHLPAAPEDG